MLELRKRHQQGCQFYSKGRPFSKVLSCKKCYYYAFGRVGEDRVRESLDTTDRSEATRAMVALEDRIKNPPRPQVSVKDAIQKFCCELKSSNRTPKTVLRYKYDLEGLAAWLEGSAVTKLAEVTTDHLSDWKAKWTTESELTRSKQQERLKRFFKWGVSRHFIQHNPTDALMSITVRKGSKRERFTDEEIERIFAVIDEIYPKDGARSDGKKYAQSVYATYPYVRAFLLALRYTALRIGDVVALRRDDISGDRIRLRVIEIESQKTGGPVHTVIPPVLLEALNAIEGNSPYYFYPHPTLDPKATLFESWKKKWWQILNPIYKKAGVRYASHAWRDTLVFKLLRKGVSLEIIARLLGHSDISMTWDHYAAWVPELQERLESVIRAHIHEV